jgi:hypothetical protein
MMSNTTSTGKLFQQPLETESPLTIPLRRRIQADPKIQMQQILYQISNWRDIQDCHLFHALEESDRLY